MTIFGLAQCCVCGIEFQVPKIRLDQSVHRKADLYCPNGHVLSWNESEADILRRERNLLTQQLAQKNDEIAARERELSTARGQMTKMRTRVNNGVCPCCTRSFSNLARHMKTKHPEVSKPRLAEAV